jgi:Metallo-peptidase family M12B Reprolysin-like
MRAATALLCVLMLAAYPVTGNTADQVWADVHPATATLSTRSGAYRQLTADLGQLRSVLAATRPQLTLPMPDGRLLDFVVTESPVMEPGLAARYPQIRTFRVRAVNDASVTGRIDIGPHGFHAFLATAAGNVFIDPASKWHMQGYLSYFQHNYRSAGLSMAGKSFSCGAHPRRSQAASVGMLQALQGTSASDEILAYRLAAATTGEYSQTVAAGDAVNTLAEVVTAINRISLIFERDLAIRLLLVANNDSLIYTDPDTDPYSNLDITALLVQNQANIDSVIGPANYDVGHVFATSDGGSANIASACDDSAKAGAATGIDNPVGDAFYIDYLAHELGHQFGADHSFNGTTYLCGDGNRRPATAFEPGSGSTIMSYGGICDVENVQQDPDPLTQDQGFMDPTFHAGSIEQVLNFVQGGIGASCPSSLLTGNAAPVVDAGPDYTVPAATAFTISGTATDVNAGDTLVHQWDQMDAGFSTDSTSYGTDLVTNALFRSFVPVAATTRTLPQLSTLLSAVPDKAETLPVSARTLTFRLTTRDGNGGVSSDDMLINVDNSKGPFALLQPNTAVTLNTRASQVIEWNAACTEQAPISCSNVDILLSTDGGGTFSPLAMSVPNDGVQAVAFPASSSTSARLMIACSNNIFFDIADVDFSLAQDGSGLTLAETGNGGSSDCGTALPAGADQEPNGTPANAQAITIPFQVNGTGNNISDADDYFSFVVTQPNRSFTLTLSIPDNPSLTRNNHDLFLLDSSGSNEIAQSTSSGSADESVSMSLSSGTSYYIRVNAKNTLGQNSIYTLSVTSTATTPPATASKGGGAFSIWVVLLLWLFAYVGRRPLPSVQTS